MGGTGLEGWMACAMENHRDLREGWEGPWSWGHHSLSHCGLDWKFPWIISPPPKKALILEIPILFSLCYEIDLSDKGFIQLIVIIANKGSTYINYLLESWFYKFRHWILSNQIKYWWFDMVRCLRSDWTRVDHTCLLREREGRERNKNLKLSISWVVFCCKQMVCNFSGIELQ